MSTDTGHHTTLLADSPPTPRRGEPLELVIDGMTCGHCVGAVRDALNHLKGVDVRRVTVGSASIDVDTQVVSPASVIEAVNGAGFQARFSDESPKVVPQTTAGTSCCSPR